MNKVIYSKSAAINTLPWTKGDKDELLVTDSGVLIIKTTSKARHAKQRGTHQVILTKHGLREMVAALEEYEK